MSNLKKWTVSLLAVLMIFSVCMTEQAFAIDIDHDVMYGSDPSLPDRDFDGIPDAYDSAPDSNVFTGKLKSGHDGTTTVSYTMDYRVFFGENTTYSPALGTVSVMGAALAYYAADYSNAYFTFDTAQTWEGGTASRVNGVQLMQVLGFEDVVDFSLDTVYNDDDLCEALFGHRTVTYNGETKVIVAIWVRGTDAKSMEEWSSNFHMGDLVRFFDQYDSVAGKSPRQSNDDWTRKTNHRGFDVCATRLLNYLKDYYLDPYVQPALDAAADATLTYWLTGHSRGAAVSNLMASYLIDGDNQVFAYTFAAPYNTANTEAAAEKYDCIFNLVNSNDFIPMMPMPEWGFTRYGKTAAVDASSYTSRIESATGETYSGKYLTASEMSTLLGKFICITGENADRSNPGKILGWREVYVYHCGHTHAGETVGNYQSTTFREKDGGFLGIGGLSESDYNGYAVRMRKYSYWEGGICQTPAYDLQVLVELLVQVAQGNTLGGGLEYLMSNKLADKFDFDKQSLISYANKLTEPHFMDTYSVIQAQINSAGDPGARFQTLPYYTASSAAGGRPVHTHTYTYVPYEGHEPSCTEPGLGYRFCVCSGTNGEYYDDYQKNVAIPATGHSWGEATYTWSADNGTVTAERVCAKDPTHVETETVTTTSEVTTEPSYDAPGVMTYTAIFENEDFETQTKEVVIPKLEHAWVEVYVIDDNDGSFMNLYLWKDGTGASPAAWPGEAMERLGTEMNGHPYYRMTVDKNLYDRLIVNAGSQQTADFNFVADEAERGYVIYEIHSNFDINLPDDVFPDDAEHKTVTDPTCTEDGKISWKGLLTGATLETAGEPATGHDWGEPVWSWTGYESATATFICENDLTHVKTVTADVTNKTTAATCEEAGGTTYTATVSFSGKTYTDTKEVTLPALGHAWSAVSYEWADDYSTVTATRSCANDPTHVETETAETTVETVEASCETPGTATYTASFENEAFETQTKTVETAPALGHAWSAVSYSWSDDNSTVTATRTCANDPAHVETETASTSYTDDPAAACESEGTRIYTASFTNPAFETQTKTVTVPATGHDWGDPTWTWDGFTAATASFVCRSDESHTVTLTAEISEEVTPVGCETDGLRVCTASVTLDGVTYTDVKQQTIAATGHRYGEPDYSWILEEDGSYTVIAAAVCLNDPAHEVTESVTAIYEVIQEPTETENGLGRYTAVFMGDLFTTQIRDVVLPKFGPDGYHIYVTDYTKGKANVGLDDEALYEGEVTFTVNSDKVCSVGILNDDGTITKLACTTTDGIHYFTVTVTDEDVYLVIVVKGDFNLDGNMKSNDATTIKKLMVELIELDESTAELQRFAGDVNDDGKLKQNDATIISRVMVELETLTW